MLEDLGALRAENCLIKLSLPSVCETQTARYTNGNGASGECAEQLLGLVVSKTTASCILANET